MDPDTGISSFDSIQSESIAFKWTWLWMFTGPCTGREREREIDRAREQTERHPGPEEWNEAKR